MNFSESLRYDYPLTPEDLVIDAGFYQGRFSKEIVERFGCRVIALEPIRRWYEEGVKMGLPRVTLINNGLAGTSRMETFSVRGDSTGLFAEGVERERVGLVGVGELLGGVPVSLLKLNIEGLEYEVLETMLGEGLLALVKHLQVQFHSNVPGCEERREKILGGLAETHTSPYSFPFCWEFFTRRGE